MKRKPVKLMILMVLMLVVSCGEPETVVTNIVHCDGSVTRRIEMRNDKKLPDSSQQVPFDSTWSIKDTLEINEKGDTTWIKTAEKLFKDDNEINLSYLTDSGNNREIIRTASFTKKFKWFNTIIRFSERVDQSLLYGYPLENFLTKEEMEYYYFPESITSGYLNGPDSTKYKMLGDSAEAHAVTCMWTGVVSEWIEEFTRLTAGKTGTELSKESLKSREKEIVRKIEKNEPNDSVLISFFLGDRNYKAFKAEADSSTEIVNQRLERNLSFNSYGVKFSMPGEVVGTNGYVDNSGELLWPVSSIYFLSQPYEMWAESKVPNLWAWIISGLFVVFVFTGLVIRVKKKG
jgi:hypothetical protein